MDGFSRCFDFHLDITQALAKVFFVGLSDQEKERIIKLMAGRGIRAWSISELSPAFLVLGFLNGISVLILALEVMYGKINRDMIQKKGY